MSVGEIVKDRGAPYTRRISTLENYQRNKVISPVQAAAGDELYWAWAVGVCEFNPDPDELPPEVRMPFGPREPTIRQVDALERYRLAMLALGKKLSWISTVCCEGVTVSEIAKMMHVRRSTLMDDFKFGLDRLAKHWESTRGSRS